MSSCFDVLDAGCPSRRMLLETTGRWGSLVLFTLGQHDRLRFSELSKKIGGVSERMLSHTLSQFVRDGFVDHQCEGSRSTYALTPSGRRVAERVEALVDELYVVLSEQSASTECTSATDIGSPAVR